MVDNQTRLDAVFGSLADPTRRDILRRISRRPLSVGEIARSYDLTLQAISKHLRVLERAKLVRKKRRGREFLVALSPAALKEADTYLEKYRELWEERLDRLEEFLKDNP
ncbi:MAG TPA: metalloregulator ArsR/SmtB family transcription factor [Candidatus Paceibacterota bacterium]|jgi:DNA-binding transcriptional ArsR family regulator|nr:metalloregulator ArsR/SmtB family transcription factor [Candidatus Paceibacterota bacterium]